MPLNTLTDQLVHDMQDLWSAESEILGQLPSLRKAAHRETLRQVLDRYTPTVSQHVAELDLLIRARGAEPSGKPCRAIAALAEANERHLLPEAADPDVKDAALVGAITRMQHYKLAGYRCLLTYAAQLEAQREADFFRRSLANEAAFLDQLRFAELLAVEDAEKG
jgi:ferritin-like metal-binding protein YciE